MKLVAASVSRGGRTARSWNFETKKVELGTDGDSLRFEFSLSSKGGGITDVKFTIGPDDFATLTSEMVSADRGTAMRAMSGTVASEIEKQPEQDKATARKARNSVTEAAELAYNDAPEGRDHAERLTWEMVRQLVEKLNKSSERDPVGAGDAA